MIKQNTRWMYTVEKASGKAARALEAQLLKSPGGQVRTVVQPDLPKANTWSAHCSSISSS